LQLLSRNRFTSIQQKTDEARAKLLQRRLHVGPLNADLQELEQMERESYNATLTAFLVSWHSKAKWIHECWGTIVPRFPPPFFFGGGPVVKQRKVANYICQLHNDNGQIIEGKEQLAARIQKFYQNLLEV